MDYKKLVITLDVDDTLYPCVLPAVEMANKKFGLSIDPNTVTDWAFSTLAPCEREAIYKIFDTQTFFAMQKPYPGAVEMVNALFDMGHDVNILSATRGPVMTARCLRLKKDFPRLPEKNILLGSRKDLVYADVHLDDGMHNIVTSPAKYPIVIRQRWNQNDIRSAGYLSVSSPLHGGYDEFLAIIKQLSLPSTPTTKHHSRKPKIICLVGPSGSGKTALAQELEKNPTFEILHSCTTRERRNGEPENAYHFISREEFETNMGSFLETTQYAGHLYGTRLADIEAIWNSGKNAVIPIDIVGALSMRQKFGDSAMLLFVHRKRHDVISELVLRDVPVEDRTARLMTLEKEYDNESVCDYTILNNKDIQSAAEQVIRLLE